MGSAPLVPGKDSLTTLPRIAGVQVSIYPRLSGAGGEVTLGPIAGSVVTNEQGQFQLPSLPPGEYTVTFVPAEPSIYRGVYAFGPLRSNSSEFAWWVVLPKK